MNLYAGWPALLHVAVVGSCAYLSLIVLLRGYGKRTLSKINAFDAAAGQPQAQVVVLPKRGAPGAQGDLLASEPRLLAHDGAFVTSAMRAERIADDEVLQAIRKHGFDQLRDVRAVVLEADGTLSVIG